MNLPPTTPSASRANSGMSRLAAMQASFQAQQMAEKEKRLINMMAARQEETVRRIAYGVNGRMDSAPHSATSLSSNNSSNSLTAGVGQRPLPGHQLQDSGYQGGRVRQFFEKQRASQHYDSNGSVENGYFTGNGSSSGQSKGPSPMGWDKSYPLKPVQPNGMINEDPGLPPETGRTPMYKRNISNASSSASVTRNKYSGNYGIRSQSSAPKDPYKGRGYSLDRSRAGSRQTSPTRKLSTGNMTRTRSQVILGNQGGIGGNSSGDDSYGSSSRPPSSGYRDWLSGSTPMYSSRNSRDLISVNNRNNLVSNGYVAGSVRNSARSVGNLSRSNSRNNLNYNPTTWFANADEDDGYDDGTIRQKTSYTREYVRNLPPTNQLGSVRSSAPPVTSRASKLARSSSSHGNLNSASIAQNSAGEYIEHCSSYSSSHSSSDKSDPPVPSYNVIPKNSSMLRSTSRGRIGSVRNGFSRHNSRDDVRDNTPISSDEPYIYDEKSKINSQTFRKSRSPTSKGRNIGVRNASNQRSPSISPSRKHSISPSRKSYCASSDDQVNNNAASVAGSNNAYNLQQQKTNAAKNKEKEEEKRRLQAEMRRREQELLNKIKEQQKMLESMKHEKSKVERELHKHEVLREKERKVQEDQKREQDKELERQRQRQARERSIDAETNVSAHRNKYSREALRAAAAAESKKEICRTSSNSTSGSKGDVEYDEVDDEYDKTYRRGSRNGGSGTTRLQRRRSPSKQLNGKPSSGPNQYNTTAYISNGEDNAVNISITSNGNNAHHDISRKPPYNSAQNSNQSKNLQNGKRNTAPNNGANSSTAPNIRGIRKGPHHPSPSPSRKPIQQTRNSHNAQTSSSSPSKASNPQTKASPTKARQSIFAPKPRDDLVACSNCGRNFAEDRIEKHEDICLKTSKKKRKTFDMTKKRVQGTDAESFVLPKGKRGITSKGTSSNAVAATSVSASKQNAGKKGDWRKKREEFINALKAAKAAQRHIAAGGNIKDLPPPPPMDTSDYVQCPYCNRRFNEGAAERHIPKCKNIKSNKR